MNVPGYTTLADILTRAYNQAAKGKGADRHANELPFDKQPMQTIAAKHGVGFLLGQADKKMIEAHGMLRRGEQDKAVHELLGAIVYVAGAILFTEAQQASTQTPAPQPTQTPAFKRGDKVKIADKIDKEAYEGPGPGYDDEMAKCLGKIGVITDLDGEDGTVKVSFKGGEYWWFMTDDLTLVRPEANDKDEEPCDCPLCTLDRILSGRGEGKAETTVVEVLLDDETDPFAKLRKALAAKATTKK